MAAPLPSGSSGMRELKKVLIANRGEIALRVIRTCREMGLRTVAVFSDADRNAPHVRAAYQAVRLGPAPVGESYLRADKILEAAKATGADAIHPGFGFLSENTTFVQAVRDAGLIFVGPSPEAILAMGDKIEARRRMVAAGVPVVPGMEDPVTDPELLRSEAERIGLPVMIKASAGGGGKGIRIARTMDELQSLADRASSEAAAAFGNGAIYLEKYLEEPRHIEVQIFGDSHGNVVHIGERECSIQRRHQKVIEERPSPLIDDELREKMGAAAVKAAKAINYENAGTLEFLVDKHRDFYMLEMNTRLQVEHPITEATSGIDLVRWQLDVAAGKPLPMTQDEIKHEGHAIECRLYAEDADNGFLPAVGTVKRLEWPGGNGVRIDSGLYEGMAVTPHYDPMLAKIIVHAHDRDAAIARMSRALSEVQVTGVVTNAAFMRRVLHSEPFQSGRYDTHTIEGHPEDFAPKLSDARRRDIACIAAAMAHTLRSRRGFTARDSAPRSSRSSAWVDAFRPGAAS